MELRHIIFIFIGFDQNPIYGRLNVRISLKMDVIYDGSQYELPWVTSEIYSLNLFWMYFKQEATSISSPFPSGTRRSASFWRWSCSLRLSSSSRCSSSTRGWGCSGTRSSLPRLNSSPSAWCLPSTTLLLRSARSSSSERWNCFVPYQYKINKKALQLKANFSLANGYGGRRGKRGPVGGEGGIPNWICWNWSEGSCVTYRMGTSRG